MTLHTSLYSSKISKIEVWHLRKSFHLSKCVVIGHTSPAPSSSGLMKCAVASWWNLARPYRETTHPCEAFLQTEISQAKSGNYRYAQFCLSKHLTFPDLSTSEDKTIFFYYPYLGLIFDGFDLKVPDDLWIYLIFIKK